MKYDAIIIGGGAAGLFCAGIAGQRGLQVLVIDHATKVAEKIRISGGGRCNFTNRDTTAAQFLSRNPHFCKSALSRFKPQDFLALLKKHQIAWHEKHKGQLFCDRSSEDIIQMLLSECGSGGVQRWQGCAVHSIERNSSLSTLQGQDGYTLHTDQGTLYAPQVVIATGGLSIPAIGATDFGLKVAKQFGLNLIETRPALVPLTFAPQSWQDFVPLAGLSLPATFSCRHPAYGAARFEEDLLFTHRGLSGPGILQISSYWTGHGPIEVNLLPKLDLNAELLLDKTRSRKQLPNVLTQYLPERLAQTWLKARIHEPWTERFVAEIGDKPLKTLAQSLHHWALEPNGSEGYKKAEVMSGGVDTDALDQKTLQAKAVPGLYFIGEVVDVTGWLGGYNFQWAWASAAACGQGLTRLPSP